MREDQTCEPMRPRDGRKFRKQTKFVHQRSEGLTRRRNGGSSLQSGRFTDVNRRKA